MPPGDGRDPETVRATETSFEVINCVQAHQGATLSTVANDLGKAKSTVHRHVRTLEELGYLTRTGDELHVGLRFLKLGETARTREDEYQLAAEKVDEFARKTNERAQFIVEEGGYGICVFRASGDQAVDTEPRVGSRMPLHATAAGRAILAFDTDGALERVLERQGLPAYTGETITDEATLRTELEETKERGYAINRNEHIDGLTAFGAPVRGPGDEIIGSFSISGPTHRYDGGKEDEIITILQGTTNELELNIRYGDAVDS
ncbi:IclR family transcriptional regulator [Natronorubrum sediminis]|nr:IclR family transcriptional regulator [Natronorubrum sediminis]